MLCIPEPSLGFTIYAKASCGYCRRAKEMLPEARVVDCDGYLSTDRDTFLKSMDLKTGRTYRTFPMVFHNGTFIGGYEDTKEFKDFNLSEDF